MNWQSTWIRQIRLLSLCLDKTYADRRSDQQELDLSRNCAAPLIAYYALKENTDGKQTNSRV